MNLFILSPPSFAHSIPLPLHFYLIYIREPILLFLILYLPALLSSGHFPFSGSHAPTGHARRHLHATPTASWQASTIISLFFYFAKIKIKYKIKKAVLF